MAHFKVLPDDRKPDEHLRRSSSELEENKKSSSRRSCRHWPSLRYIKIIKHTSLSLPTYVDTIARLYIMTYPSMPTYILLCSTS